ncbi:MAG: helix-turn-helix domain-containing protein, partial [Gammaproteobacteria bacterium]|nr:helix-turn-helix domain-containing protein [Gammaproteobacteria bacterium]
TEFKWNVSRVKTALNIVLAGLVLGTILTRSIIADVTPTPEEISLTRVPGDLYWMWQLYIVGGLLFAVSLLIRGLKRTASNINRQKCLVVLISTATPVATTISIIVLMAMGVNINGAIFMSLSLTLILALMVYAEEKTRLFHLLTFVPFTKERKLHKQLLRQVTDCIAISDDPTSQQSIQLKQMMRDFEGLVVEHVLDYYSGNQKKTANALGVSEATLSRRARACARRHTKQSSEQTYSADSVRITQ